MLRVEPFARPQSDSTFDDVRRKVAKGAFRLDRAELVARTFLNDVGDNEVPTVGRQLRKGRDDAEVGIALGQVKCPKLLLVGRKPVRIVAIVRLEEAEYAACLPSEHLLAQALILEGLVADDVDAANLGLVALVDLENEIDAILLKVDDLRFDPRSEAALALVKLDNALDVRADLGAGKDLARLQLDLRDDLVVLDALVTLQDDAVDDRILSHGDDDIARLGTGDDDVGEKLRRVELLQRGIEGLGRITLARGEICVRTDRVRLETLIAAHRDRTNRAGGLRSWGNGRRRSRRSRGRRSRRGRCCRRRLRYCGRRSRGLRRERVGRLRLRRCGDRPSGQSGPDQENGACALANNTTL